MKKNADMKSVGTRADMLEGRLFPKILAFVLPLMLTNLLQMFYNAADMVIVGLSDAPGALGAIGTTGPMINLIVNVFIGFSVGTNVVVARWIGAGEREQIHRAVHTSLGIAVIFGALGCAAGQLVCRPMLVALGDEGHILDLAERYSRIYFAGIPFLSVTNFCSAILRAKGDTKTPLVVLSISGLFNVGMNLLFVLVCHMDVDGVALATVLANLLSAMVLVWRLCCEEGACRLSWRKLRIYWQSFWDILRVGIPAAIQGALFSVSNLLIQSSIVQINNTMYPGGSAVIDGHAAGGSLEGFVYTLTNAVAQAGVTFTSQHYGAGKYRRIGAVMRSCYLTAFLMAVLPAALVLLLQKPLVGLYVRDPAAMDAAAIRNRIMLVPYFLLAFMEVGSYVLRGLGKSVSSTVISLLGACVFRVFWVLVVFPANPTLECIYISYPISWGLTAAIHFTAGQLVWRKLLKKEKARES